MEFGALTVDLVMKRTGMSRSAFYHYFSGLDDLAVALLEQFEDEIRESVDPWLKGADAGEPLQATATHLTAMFEVMAKHRTDVRAVAQAAGGYPRVYRQWQIRVVDYFIELSTEFIRRQVALGLSAVKDPNRLAHALVQMNHAVFYDNLMRETPDEPAAVARVIADIWNGSIYGRTS